MNTKNVALSVKYLETPKETNKTNACAREKKKITTKDTNEHEKSYSRGGEIITTENGRHGKTLFRKVGL